MPGARRFSTASLLSGQRSRLRLQIVRRDFDFVPIRIAEVDRNSIWRLGHLVIWRFGDFDLEI